MIVMLDHSKGMTLFWLFVGDEVVGAFGVESAGLLGVGFVSLIFSVDSLLFEPSPLPSPGGSRKKDLDF